MDRVVNGVYEINYACSGWCETVYKSLNPPVARKKRDPEIGSSR
jgi:hypothetical protein